jgi:hypothetical protein
MQYNLLKILTNNFLFLEKNPTKFDLKRNFAKTFLSKKKKAEQRKEKKTERPCGQFMKAFVILSLDKHSK